MANGIKLSNMASPDPHVVFIHLDLGIGGAESLVLNLAKATDGSYVNGDESSSASCGSVSIYTTHCSPTHCYDEVKPPDGPLFSCVHVRGSWIPRSFYLGGTALCSALRMLYLTCKAIKENPQANVFVIDVLPTGVPYLVEYCNVNAGVLFYCHFPDKLLTRDTINGETGNDDGNSSDNKLSLVHYLKGLKRIYRWALDTMEEWSMSYSDLIVVNSKFTRGEVEKVFPSFFAPRSGFDDCNENKSDGRSNGRTGQDERVKVLYPSIESSLSKERKAKHRKSDLVAENETETEESTISSGPIVSLNRFERKKNVALLLHAYDLLLKQATEEGRASDLPSLIIAGGYDPLNVENVEHLGELRTLADEILDRYNLPRSTVCSPSKSSATAKEDGTMAGSKGASVAFHPSISNSKRTQLLACASVWCYTPHREHFGIVPLEAMDAGVPVVAIKSGGPMESIVDGVTGYLVDYSADETDTVKGFANAIHKLLKNPKRSQVMGQRGRERVDQAFGMEIFRKQWWDLLKEAQSRGLDRHRKACNSYPSLGWSVIRTLGEMFWVVLFALAVTVALKWFGLW